jgi:uncharacterized protein YcgI (DUF1989 family)
MERKKGCEMTGSIPPTPINRIRIEPQSGTAFVLEQGQVIRIVDVEGGQVSDLFCFFHEDIEEALSAGHTTDYNNKIFLSEGDILYSNRSNPMFTITADQVGRHIMLYAPCSQKMFEKSYGVTEPHPNCLDNLVANLRKFDIRASDISIPFNIFMNVEINQDGETKILSPKSKAGDFITLRAEMDLIVGVTTCSAGACNDFKWTPVDVEIYS